MMHGHESRVYDMASKLHWQTCKQENAIASDLQGLPESDGGWGSLALSGGIPRGDQTLSIDVLVRDHSFYGPTVRSLNMLGPSSPLETSFVIASRAPICQIRSGSVSTRPWLRPAVRAKRPLGPGCLSTFTISSTRVVVHTFVSLSGMPSFLFYRQSFFPSLSATRSPSASHKPSSHRCRSPKDNHSGETRAAVAITRLFTPEPFPDKLSLRELDRRRHHEFD